MGFEPSVSVITPFLNEGQFLREAIDGVFAQTFGGWELLLVDDGSTDDGTAIARSYAARYPDKVKYLDHQRHENRGACASRNLALRHARGEYIALLDADDLWLPHKLERQLAIMEADPRCGLLFGRSSYWRSWTGSLEDKERDFVPDCGVATDTLFDRPVLLKLLHPLGPGAAPCPSDILMRRSVVTRVGGFEESFRGIYQLYEDQAFLAKMYLAAPVFVAGECWDYYRLHPDSCVATVTRSGKQDLAERFYLAWLENYFTEHNIRDAELWRSLRRKLRRHRHPKLSHLFDYGRYRVEKIKSLIRGTTSED